MNEPRIYLVHQRKLSGCIMEFCNDTRIKKWLEELNLVACCRIQNFMIIDLFDELWY